MNIIYVIVAYGGEYDDAWESNLFARRTKDDAELAIIQLLEQDARIKAALPKLRDQFIELKQKHPLQQEEVPPHPKGPAKQTKENREAHQLAWAEHQRVYTSINARNQAKMSVWTEEMANHQRAFAKELGLSDADMAKMHFPVYLGHHSEVEYRIDELEIA